MTTVQAADAAVPGRHRRAGAGSYRPDATTAGGRPAERLRLAEQAALSWPAERDVLVGIGLRRYRSMVEVGAGSGAVTRLLRNDFPDVHLTAVDVSDELLDPAAGADVTAVADGAHLPLPDASRDAVLLRYVLQHVSDPVPMLREAMRVVRPGGQVIVTDVDAAMWGVAEPAAPKMASVYSALDTAQRDRGGDRLIARRLTRLLAAVGCERVALLPFATTSDDRPVGDFELHLGPGRLAPLVADGAVTVGELAAATAAWQRFAADPAAWVMLLGFTAVGHRPDGGHRSVKGADHTDGGADHAVRTRLSPS